MIPALPLHAHEASPRRASKLGLASPAARLFLVLLLLVLLLGFAPARAGAVQSGTVQTSWRLLDYIAVDYSGAVTRGRVVKDTEYVEMREFSATVAGHLRSLHPGPARASLVAKSEALRQAIDRKAPADEVAGLARDLAADLLRAYPVPLAPGSLPDVARGAEIYRSQCATCHGVSGDGRGPAAAQLDPPPIDFTDRERASRRSIFALEQVIAQGLEGTAMQSFAHLPSDDRWALAFYVGALPYPSPLGEQGEKIWKSDPQLRARIPDLKTLVALTPQELAGRIGPEKAAAVMAYLRSTPDAVQAGGEGSLALTRSRLGQSLEAYRAGDRENATRLALSAYLDGFEPVEPLLSARNGSLKREIERGMAELRARISGGETVGRVEEQGLRLDSLFTRAEQALGSRAESGISTFVSALTILLREGLEALLIVIAMIAVLRKSDRADALPYVHGGWVAAVAAGVLTWVAATTLISVSGASRELTEGLGALLAAVVLVSVGIWMHGKSQADAWQRYIKQRMNRALTRGSAWFLFGLAFIVVYREVFETILFFAAIWNEESKLAVMAGAASGVAGLAVIGWAMMRYSLRLPVGRFFQFSSMLIAVLAIVLAGKGIAAIQEGGLMGITPVTWVPQIDMLGLHPSLQVLAAQLAVFLAIMIGFRINLQRAARAR